MNATADLIRQCFAAYETKDRKLIEGLLSDDFTFTSPVDDHISRDVYFERCWPNSEHLKSFQIQKLFVEGDEGFVTYVGESTDGDKFQNTEFFKTAAGKICEVTVYFGSDLAGNVEEEEIRTLLDATVEACRNKNVKALMACYAPGVLAFDLIVPLSYEGASEVGKRVREWFDSFQGSTLGYDLSHLTISAGNEASFAHSLNHVSGTKTDGQKIEMWWRATLGFSKVDGRWLITHAHNSVPFEMETARAALDLRP